MSPSQTAKRHTEWQLAESHRLPRAPQPSSAPGGWCHKQACPASPQEGAGAALKGCKGPSLALPWNRQALPFLPGVQTQDLELIYALWGGEGRGGGGQPPMVPFVVAEATADQSASPGQDLPPLAPHTGKPLCLCKGGRGTIGNPLECPIPGSSAQVASHERRQGVKKAEAEGLGYPEQLPARPWGGWVSFPASSFLLQLLCNTSALLREAPPRSPSHAFTRYASCPFFANTQLWGALQEKEPQKR